MPGKRTGSVVILSLASIGLLFFVGLQLSKHQRLETPGPDISSVAVLPAKVLGGPETAYLADAVPAGLLAVLGQIKGLHVTVVASDAPLNGQPCDAEVCLIPAITADRDHLVLTLQAIDSRTQRLLWSNQFQGSPKNYKELVQRAAEEAARAIRRN